MKDDIKDPEATCKREADSLSRSKQHLPAIADRIIESCSDSECFTHIDNEPIPSEGYVVEIIDKLREVLFPGYFTRERIDPINLKYYMGQAVSVLFDKSLCGAD